MLAPLAPAAPPLRAVLEDIVERPATAPNRLVALQRYCRDELARLGCQAELEVGVHGAYVRRGWDVAQVHRGGRPRIAISCKSIFCDHTGAAPNRLDELLGEAANIHRRYPSAALGYLLLVSRRDRSVAADARRRRPDYDEAAAVRRSDQWFEGFGAQLAEAGRRYYRHAKAERWEAISMIQLDHDSCGSPMVRWHPSLCSAGDLFSRLVRLADTRDAQRTGDNEPLWRLPPSRGSKMLTAALSTDGIVCANRRHVRP